MTSNEEQFDELFQRLSQHIGSPVRTEVPRFMKMALADLSRRLHPHRIPPIYIKLMESFPFEAMRNSLDAFSWFFEEVPEVIKLTLEGDPDQLLPVGYASQTFIYVELDDAENGMLWSRDIVDGDYTPICTIQRVLRWMIHSEDISPSELAKVPPQRECWPSKWTSNLPENRFAVPRIKTGDAEVHPHGTLVEFEGKIQIDRDGNWFVNDDSGPVRIVGEDPSGPVITTWHRYTPGHIYSQEEIVTTYPFVPPPYRTYTFFGFIEDDPLSRKHIFLGASGLTLRNGRWSDRTRGTTAEDKQRAPRSFDYDICSFVPADQDAFKRVAMSDQRSGPRDPAELDDVFETFIRQRDAEVLVAEVDGEIAGTVVALPGVDGLDEPAWLSAPGRDDIAEALLYKVEQNRRYTSNGRLWYLTWPLTDPR